MTAALYRLGRFCANHPGRVILVWLLAVAVIGAFALLIGQQTSNQLTLPGTDSQRASNLLQNNFPDEANGSVPVAFRAPKGEKLTDSRYKKPIENVTKAYSNHPGVAKVTGPFDQEGSDQLNKQETIGYISLNLKDGQGQLDDGTARSIIAVDRPLEKAGLDPAAGGYLGQEVSRPSTHPSEITGLIAAMIILLFTFGTVVAMGLPIVTAILGLGAGLGIVTLLSNVLTVPTAAPALATMIGLGVGIDYALFIVTRYRDQLAEGLEAKESAARATPTGGGGVVLAGSTVIKARVGLSRSGAAVGALL
ncbi:MAG: MMPL family transporter, partial [Rubrobacteraceae bacterium]